MLDLYHAARDEVIRIIVDQRDTLADQERRIAAQDRELGELRTMIARLTTQVGERKTPRPHDDDPGRGTPKGMPGLKSTEPDARPPRPRKRRVTGAGRSRMQATARVVHALAGCPDCGAPLAGGSVKRTREVIELPTPAVVVTEHVSLERHCPDCGKRCVPVPELGDAVCGQRRLGHGLVSLITVLREEAR